MVKDEMLKNYAKQSSITKTKNPNFNNEIDKLSQSSFNTIIQGETTLAQPSINSFLPQTAVFEK